MVEHSNRETVEPDERASTRRTDDATMTRRRTLQLGGLVGVGSVLGAVGLGADGVAAAEGSRPDDIVHLDYDDYDSWSDIYRLSNGDSADLNFVSSPTYTGENALQLQVNENDHWGANAHYDFEDGLFELNNRMRFALNTNWSMEGRSLANCRIWNCALSTGEASAGGTTPDGTNGWSNRMYVTSRGTDPDGPFHLLSDTYHIDEPQDHNYIMDDDEYAVAQPEIERGVWYEFESYVCVNTISNGEPNNDGIVRYWLDGDLIFEREDFSFTSDLGDNIIDSTGPVGHYGGRYQAPQDLFTYYDTHSMALNGAFEFESCDGDRTFDASDEPDDATEETDSDVEESDADDGDSDASDAEEIEDELEDIEDTLEDSGVEFPQGLGELFSN